MTAIILGLAAFWVPIVGSIIEGHNPYAALVERIQTGALATFGFVILADGLGTAISALKSGTNITAAGIRGVIGSIAIILLTLNIVLIISKPGESVVVIWFHIILTIFAIICASYLYCFRTSDWEEGVSKIKEQEDNHVDALKSGVVSIKNDDDGVAL